jgi:hypothetical protein
MNIIETEDFKKDFEYLPISIRKLYQKQKEIFKKIGLIQGFILKELKNFPEYILFELHEGTELFFILGTTMLYFSKSVTEKIFINKPDSKFRHLVFAFRL